MKLPPVSVKELLPLAAQIAAGIAPSRIKDLGTITDAEAALIASEAVLISTALILFVRQALK